MALPSDDLRQWTEPLRSLGVQVALFLTMALLPIGFIAIYQTNAAQTEADRRISQAYLALTTEAAGEQREIIERAFGVANALIPLVQALGPGHSECTAHFDRFVRKSELFSSVGFTDQNGQSHCNSGGRAVDFSETPAWIAGVASVGPRIDAELDPAANGLPVLVVSQPTYDADTWTGYVSVSIPMQRLDLRDMGIDLRPRHLLMLSVEGEVLTAGRPADGSDPVPLADHTNYLPADVTLADMAQTSRGVIELASVEGTTYRYAVTPIVPEVVYALGVWDARPANYGQLRVPAGLFPVMMWVASLVVAYFALDRLVLRHVRGLNWQMRQFGRRRVLTDRRLASDAPSEFLALQDQFTEMANAVLRDEEALETAVTQKSVLLKEVHHRVKNNLQMISSIINMQVRGAGSGETRDVLVRLQDRILGLAMIHRNLHEIEDMGQINAGRMLDDLLNQILVSSGGSGPAPLVERGIAPVVLYPDQTVPLSLLFSELVANALKYGAAAAEDGRRHLTVRFEPVGDDRAVELTVGNSTSPERRASDQSTGLGSRLIDAFAKQLNATVSITSDPRNHEVAVRFMPQDFEPEMRDF